MRRLRSGVVSVPSSLPEARDRKQAYLLEAANEWWWRLTVYLDISFNFSFASDSERWNGDQFRTWKLQFKNQIEIAWTRRWHVRATEYTRPFAFSTQPLPVVEVKVDVRERPESEVPPNRLWIIRVNVGFPQETQRRTQYRDHTGNRGPNPVGAVHLNGTDIDCTATRVIGDGRYRFQRPIVHEAAHMLGVDHPNHGPSDGTDQYVRASHADSDSRRIAGSGMNMSNLDYLWARQLMENIEPDYNWELIPAHGVRPRPEMRCPPNRQRSRQ